MYSEMHFTEKINFELQDLLQLIKILSTFYVSLSFSEILGGTIIKRREID